MIINQSLKVSCKQHELFLFCFFVQWNLIDYFCKKMPSLCVVVVVLVEIVRSGRLGQSFATLGSRKLLLYLLWKVQHLTTQLICPCLCSQPKRQRRYPLQRRTPEVPPFLQKLTTRPRWPIGLRLTTVTQIRWIWFVRNQLLWKQKCPGWRIQAHIQVKHLIFVFRQRIHGPICHVPHGDVKIRQERDGHCRQPCRCSPDVLGEYIENEVVT